MALIATAKANLDEYEIQDDRGPKHGTLARTPPHTLPSASASSRPPDVDSRKKTRSLEAALTAAAPLAAAPQPNTATNYAAAALSAADPHRRFA